ncbi:MAG: phosphoheptose isomerase [Alphaproteobacteria bacterium RIFCSPHIGHO2_01_FULL_41_14]|nr:MAG: phosphoheptose isomerase [Alphaproteobacteria bacterium GWB1_45_5]OFW75954.1 MAG: phosphoheptose isomerase [Alphaproteobacteria bacterium GWA1_45_9]OFW90136.1 MAG: phosphoheptose isomerase [Alphaproteobacteria bacterium RIFCSPHIGHO2_01_FULL_41_14]HCI48362.1 phosphoheptose isomerase [Holosporales bacterium]
MTFNLQQFYKDEFEEHLKVAQLTQDHVYEPFKSLVKICTTSIQNGGKILFFGNGGSAGDAQHLATELVVRYRKNRVPIAALALTTDTSALTAIGNDLGFEFLFSRQIEALGKRGDVAIGITTSGKSPNVIKGLEMARKKGLTAASLTGKKGGDLLGLADPLIIVPSDITARIQEMHITLGQMLCDALEKELKLETYS